MTITRAKGEGNGHVYHIEEIDLPLHRIKFVSCFISLIDNTGKKRHFIEKKNEQNCHNLRGSKFAGQSIFSFAYLMCSHVRSQELCARTMTTGDAYQVIHSFISFIHFILFQHGKLTSAVAVFQ